MALRTAQEQYQPVIMDLILKCKVRDDFSFPSSHDDMASSDDASSGHECQKMDCCENSSKICAGSSLPVADDTHKS
jgi:hypothetical protein